MGDAEQNCVEKLCLCLKCSFKFMYCRIVYHGQSNQLTKPKPVHVTTLPRLLHRPRPCLGYCTNHRTPKNSSIHAKHSRKPKAVTKYTQAIKQKSSPLNFLLSKQYRLTNEGNLRKSSYPLKKYGSPLMYLLSVCMKWVHTIGCPIGWT